MNKIQADNERLILDAKIALVLLVAVEWFFVVRLLAQVYGG